MISFEAAAVKVEFEDVSTKVTLVAVSNPFPEELLKLILITCSDKIMDC
jgi:hypothetical protein